MSFPSESLFQAYGVPRNLLLEVNLFVFGGPPHDVGTVSIALETLLCCT